MACNSNKWRFFIESSDIVAHDHKRDWPLWTEFSVWKNNVNWEPLLEPRKVSAAKADVGVVTQKKGGMECKEFPKKLTRMKKAAWNSFIAVVFGFLGNHKAENYVELVETLISSIVENIKDRSQSIHTEQMKSNIEQQKQAQKMIDNSVKRFQPAKVGETVMVPVPLVDRGRAEFPNVKAVVFQALDNGTYKLGTKHGLLKQVYTRNQFTPCLEKFLSLDDVVQEREVSLREVAIAESMGQDLREGMKGSNGTTTSDRCTDCDLCQLNFFLRYSGKLRDLFILIL
ncbi:uncharacterized protein LOC135094310 [Scylla paramamosain]|uniref:uncharacterized protein LOC135094310 n=1 Tax=Scylla paramamosain TaxID=85552 RepID=UPI003083D945